MRVNMDFKSSLPVVIGLLFLNVLFVSCQGPVYIDPAAKIESQPAPAPNNDLITQTVYGFLDFTTTIGNTVMVFSPQSSQIPNAVKEEEKPTSPPIIETQPTTPKTEPILEIKPSKPISKPTVEKKAVLTSKVEVIAQSVITKKEPQSVVNVVQGVPSVIKESPKIVASKVEVVVGPSVISEKKSIVSKVEVVTGPSKVVENPSKKTVQSKVEVKEGPKSAATPKKEIITKVEVRSGPSVVVNTPQILSSRVEVVQGSQSSISTQQLKSVVEVLSSSDDDEPPILVPNNNIGEPEYDFLSRQPSEVVEETYKVINLRPSKAHKPKQAAKPKVNTPASQVGFGDDEHPIGLVTKLGGTIIKEGLTTVHETSVIGTLINGKYAQVLHSTSHVLQPSGPKHKINATPTLRIMKTAAPVLGKNHRHVLEPTPATFLNEETALPLENLFGSSPNLIRPSRRPAVPGGSFKNRFRSHEPVEEEEEVHSPPPQARNVSAKKNKNRSNSQRSKNNARYGKTGKSSTPASQLATVSVFSDPSPPGYRRQHKSGNANNNNNNNNRHGSYKATSTVQPQQDTYTRRGYKPRIQASTVEPIQASSSTSLYKFKLNRTPGRWQYKTTPKPRVTIRKIIGDDDQPTTPLSVSTLDDSQINDVNPQSRSDNLDLELSGSHNGPGSLLDEDANDNSIDKGLSVETIKVEISTPADFRDIYYEIATVKSPYTFQVGTVKNTRFITVTSTIEKSFEPTEIRNPVSEPLTENILASTSHFDKENNLLDSSIATLPAIALPVDAGTPPLETLTETFSTTQTMLKTHILPVIYNGINTTSYTLTQTYHVTRLVTATKTLPPMEVYQFVPSKTLNEFNSRLDEAGSELHLELEFGDDNEQDEEGQLRRAFPPDLNLANIGSDFDLSEVDKSRFAELHLRQKKAHSLTGPKTQHVTEPPTAATPALTPEQAQQLALLRLINPAAAAQIPNIITTSKPVIKLETVYESHVIPVFNGQSTIQSTISRIVATVTKTEYEIGTSSLPPLPVQPINPLFPQQNPFQLTSTPIVTHTEVTATESKVLKLTFGAKTAYTTLYSTKVVPTILTTYITNSVPIPQTAAPFPGYFPAPYGPYPFVG